jgi:hypothetical protein
MTHNYIEIRLPVSKMKYADGQEQRPIMRSFWDNLQVTQKIILTAYNLIDNFNWHKDANESDPFGSYLTFTVISTLQNTEIAGRLVQKVNIDQGA